MANNKGVIAAGSAAVGLLTGSFADRYSLNVFIYTQENCRYAKPFATEWYLGTFRRFVSSPFYSF